MAKERNRADSEDELFASLRLAEAQRGSREALGSLFAECRQFLLLVANQALDAQLRRKVGASDLVQETFLEAHRQFDQFNGYTKEDLLIWLRQILLNNLRDASRRYRRAGKRRISLERPLSAGVQIRAAIDAGSSRPSEKSYEIADFEVLQAALAQLPDEYQQAIELRNLELKSFVEIGRLMDKTPEAARKLWSRAIEAMQRQMGVYLEQ